MEILIFIGIVFSVVWLFSRVSKGKSRQSDEKIDEYSHLLDDGDDIVISVRTSYYGDEDEGDSSVRPEKVWIPWGESSTVSGYNLQDGLLYVGKGLKGVNGWGLESALINPKLKVNKKNPDITGSTMTYWPSYSQITPEARAAYLEWLASGRSDSETYIGYVFLYFYGLERRALADSKLSPIPMNEITAIRDEATRLLNIYGENNSFSGYALGFINYINAIHFPDDNIYVPVETNRHLGGIPFDHKYKIAKNAVGGKVISATAALAHIDYDPAYYFRTPANRCRTEFKELFSVRYKEAFGEGCKVKPNKKRLKVSYHPASSSLGGRYTHKFAELPDTTALKQPWQKIRDLADSCTDELDAHSRFLGRYPDKKNGAEAFALLPAELFESHLDGKLLELSHALKLQFYSQDHISIPFKDFMVKFPYLTITKFNKREAVSLAQFLEKLGIGIEPDVRFFGKTPKDGNQIVLYKLPLSFESSPSDQYAHAALMIELAAMVAAADGIVTKEEEEHLEAHLEKQLHLSESERARLKAKLNLHLLDGGQTRIAKKHIEALDTSQREFIGSFMAGIAQADNHIDPKEVKTLEKLYKSLGLDVQTLYSTLHGVASEPITVISEGSKEGFPIPAPSEVKVPGVELDKDTIAAKLRESAAVSTMLSTIFSEEDEYEKKAHESKEKESLSIEGLDSDASALLHRILEQQSWERVDLEVIATELDVMLDGAIDSINDVCIEAHGEPLIEGEDSLEVNDYVAKELKQ